jgi:hypothetical protein
VIVLAAAAVALAALPAPARPPRPTMSVTPARLALTGASSATVHLASAAVSVVDAQATGLAVDLRGRPRVASPGNAAAWLEVTPRHFTVRPTRGAGISVTAKPPPGARPGDHVALLLLTTHPSSSRGVAVRVRIGIVVTVRVPGKVRRRLVLEHVRLRRRGSERIVEIDLANRGNVTERLARGWMVVTLMRHGRVLVRLSSAPRDLLPFSRGRTTLVYRGAARGWARVLVEVGLPRRGAHAAGRSFRLRL